jgi:hypothetical protein
MVGDEVDEVREGVPLEVEDEDNEDETESEEPGVDCKGSSEDCTGVGDGLGMEEDKDEEGPNDSEGAI